MKQILLSEMVPREILQELQDAFANYTGMASLISDANGTPITNPTNFTHFCRDLTRKSAVGGKNCQECGRKGALKALQSGHPAVYPCHAGLMDYAAPIILNGEFIGSFTGGQIRSAEVDDEMEEHFRKKAAEYSIDPDEYVAAAKETNLLPREDIERSAEFLSKIASAVSKVAYERFLLLEQKQKLEEVAKARKDRLQEYSVSLDSDLAPVVDFLEESVNKDVGLKKHVLDMTGQMLRSTEELRQIIDNMEMDQDDFSLSETTYDIRWIIERKRNELSDKAGMKGLDIVCEIGTEVPRMLIGDPTRISSLVGQLISNSIFYSRDNKPIDIKVSSEKEGYAVVLEISVADKGNGMTQEDVVRISNYINSVDRLRSFDENYESAGFAMIGYIVRAMNGELSISSEPGEGTVFSIRLPQLAG